MCFIEIFSDMIQLENDYNQKLNLSCLSCPYIITAHAESVSVLCELSSTYHCEMYVMKLVVALS